MIDIAEVKTKRRRKRPFQWRGRRFLRTTLFSVWCFYVMSNSIVGFIIHPSLSNHRHQPVKTRKRIRCTAVTNDSSCDGGGVFRPFADFAIQRLKETGWVQPLTSMPLDLQHKVSSRMPSSLYKRQHSLPQQRSVSQHNNNDTTTTTLLQPSSSSHSRNQFTTNTNTKTTATVVPFDDYRVHISVTALEATEPLQQNSPIQYARIVLIRHCITACMR
jgi:hypothetical protein